MYHNIFGVKRSVRLAAAALAALSVGVFSQELVTARVPVTVNVDASVSIMPGVGAAGEGTRKNLTANVADTLDIRIAAGETNLRHGQPAARGSHALVRHRRGGALLTLSPQVFDKADVSLYSVSGKRVMRGKVSGRMNENRTLRAKLSAGVYLLSVKGAGGGSFSSALHHKGGNMNITVEFDGAARTLGKRADDADAAAIGSWTISATSSVSGNSVSRPFTPREGMNEPVPLTFPEDDANNVVNVTYSASGQAVVVNPLAGGGVSVSVSGQHVTVGASAAAESRVVKYVLSGNTNNGSFKLYSDYRFGLTFNGVSITNPSGPAVNIQSGKRGTITLADNTVNSLTDGQDYQGIPSGEDAKAVLFSEGQMIFDGGGSLSVTGKYKHAVCSDDWIEINGGSMTLKSATDGIHVNQYFVMTGGELTVTDAGSDGIDVERDSLAIRGGTVKIAVSGDGGKAVKSAGNMTISGGNIELAVNGGAYHDSGEADNKSPAGIKCDGDLVIKDDPVIKITAVGSGGKGINAGGTLTISGGTIDIKTSGVRFCYDAGSGGVTACPANTGGGGRGGNTGGNVLTSSAKGIKSLGDMTISGGRIVVETETPGAEGLESKARITINGGYVSATTYDDAINAGLSLTVNGGQIHAYASDNDALDSNGETLTIAGGVVVASGSEASVDCDSRTFAITGGTLIGVGGNMTSTPTSSAVTQRTLYWSATPALTKDQVLSIRATNGGAEILTFKMPRAVSGNSRTVFSSPQMLAGTGYNIYTGGTVSGGSDFHGLYTDASSSGGTQAATFTTTNMVTTLGGSSGGGGGGGRR